MPSPDNPTKQTGRHTILVVDDTRDFVDFLYYLLSHNGFSVRRALSGPQCLEEIGRHAVDLVILDVMMPQMNGLEVCKQLKKNLPSIPIILLTAKDDLATRGAAMALGVSEFLAKPVNIEDLMTRVRTQIQMCQLEKNVETTFFKAEQEARSLRGNT